MEIQYKLKPTSLILCSVLSGDVQLPVDLCLEELLFLDQHILCITQFLDSLACRRRNLLFAPKHLPEEAHLDGNTLVESMDAQGTPGRGSGSFKGLDNRMMTNWGNILNTVGPVFG